MAGGFFAERWLCGVFIRVVELTLEAPALGM